MKKIVLLCFLLLHTMIYSENTFLKNFIEIKIEQAKLEQARKQLDACRERHDQNLKEFRQEIRSTVRKVINLMGYQAILIGSSFSLHYYLKNQNPGRNLTLFHCLVATTFFAEGVMWRFNKYFEDEIKKAATQKSGCS